jgi:alpha-amylase
VRRRVLTYGPFDDYDIGSKNQKGSVPNRFGTREQLQRCAAILRANGIDIYLDMVEHHRAGDGGQPPDAFVFRYLGANGTPGTGRFPKKSGQFPSAGSARSAREGYGVPRIRQ